MKTTIEARIPLFIDGVADPTVRLEVGNNFPISPDGTEVIFMGQIWGIIGVIANNLSTRESYFPNGDGWQIYSQNN